jgi:hypothetical protein
MNDQRRAESGLPPFFWWIVVGAVLSLGGGVTLFVMNQRGSLGVGAGAGPGLASESYTPQQRVEIWKNESWHPGVILGVDGPRYRVHYEQPVFRDETVDPTRLRARRE